MPERRKRPQEDDADDEEIVVKRIKIKDSGGSEESENGAEEVQTPRINATKHIVTGGANDNFILPAVQTADQPRITWDWKTVKDTLFSSRDKKYAPVVKGKWWSVVLWIT